jgi:SanA protein
VAYSGFQRLRRSFRRTVLLLLVLLIGSYLVIWHTVTSQANPYMYSLDKLPTRQVAVILGAQVEGQQLSDVLTRRVEAGIALYKQHKVAKLLMSGDGTSKYYDEVTPMRNFALQAGVPDADIMVDPLGLRTYDTCSRLKSTFKVTQPILVTQNDHLRRAIYTCRSLGVEAIGYSYEDTSIFQNPQFFFHEQGALVLAWLDVTIIHPDPIQSNPN